MTSARRRPVVHRITAVLALIGVAACGGVTADAIPPTTPTVAAATAAATPWAATPEPPAARIETATATPPPEPERQPPPASLSGLDEGQLSGLLGQPRFKRRDDPAQIWQYRNDACALDVFLYKSGKDGPFTVLHVETRGRNKNPVDHNDCVATLLRDHNSGRAG